ncbi:MAG: hypothetical protein LBB98_00675, partial [Treponema sp.]|nr:hypothetical protein [Treponema sp.]
QSKRETKKIARECYKGSRTGDRFERWYEYNLLKKVAIEMIWPLNSEVLRDSLRLEGPVPQPSR